MESIKWKWRSRRRWRRRIFIGKEKVGGDGVLAGAKFKHLPSHQRYMNVSAKLLRQIHLQYLPLPPEVVIQHTRTSLLTSQKKINRLLKLTEVSRLEFPSAKVSRGLNKHHDKPKSRLYAGGGSRKTCLFRESRVKAG